MHLKDLRSAKEMTIEELREKLVKLYRDAGEVFECAIAGGEKSISANGELMAYRVCLGLLDQYIAANKSKEREHVPDAGKKAEQVKEKYKRWGHATDNPFKVIERTVGRDTPIKLFYRIENGLVTEICRGERYAHVSPGYLFSNEQWRGCYRNDWHGGPSGSLSEIIDWLCESELEGHDLWMIGEPEPKYPVASSKKVEPICGTCGGQGGYSKGMWIQPCESCIEAGRLDLVVKALSQAVVNLQQRINKWDIL